MADNTTQEIKKYLDDFLEEAFYELEPELTGGSKLKVTINEKGNKENKEEFVFDPRSNAFTLWITYSEKLARAQERENEALVEKFAQKNVSYLYKIMGKQLEKLEDFFDLNEEELLVDDVSAVVISSLIVLDDTKKKKN